VEPANNRFGGGAADTMLHPLVAVAMLIAIVLMFVLPRKYVLVPLLLASFMIPLGQVVVLGGVHFTFLRIITGFGLVRCAASNRPSKMNRLSGGFNSIDGAFTLWAFTYALSFVLLYMDGPALINRLGFLLDALGGYFLLRFLIQDNEDVRRVIRTFLVLAVVMAIAMIIEHATMRNVFGIFGGVRAAPEVRDGKIRASGVFQHSILAGCFGATLVPLFATFWPDRNSRSATVIGVISSTIIMLTANASTPITAFVGGIVAMCFWPFRHRMRAFRWGIALTLVVLHLVMKAPVWALIARVDFTGSSSSYHRYMLLDNCIRHFWDWWLIGVKDYNNWGWDMWDLSNQYVAYAVTGGLAPLVCFIIIISKSFGKLGTGRKRMAGDRKQEWLLWCMGSALFAHVMAYFGIGYFDQTEVAWFALLAMISAASQAVVAPRMVSTQSVVDLPNRHLADFSQITDLG